MIERREKEVVGDVGGQQERAFAAEWDVGWTDVACAVFSSTSAGGKRAVPLRVWRDGAHFKCLHGRGTWFTKVHHLTTKDESL